MSLLYRLRRASETVKRLSPLERLAEVFLGEPMESNIELIRRLRAAHFADVEELLKSGKLKLPK